MNDGAVSCHVSRQSQQEQVKPKLEALAKAYKEETGDEGAPDLKF
jgi:hypothetical protein